MACFYKENYFKVVICSCLAERKIMDETSPTSYDFSTSVFYVDFNFIDRQLPLHAPPPRLHYSTFWRSVSKRVYSKHTEEIIRAAKARSPMYAIDDYK